MTFDYLRLMTQSHGFAHERLFNFAMRCIYSRLVRRWLWAATCNAAMRV